ncbi:S-adenosyl-L-methionine-dependent methyltransferase [Annulohypoxylon truncatum]|uniref:S-adenosyl-L-methionine-dependent methyltransferase n=1 Tax=Annulohypoxylon truncatum TaxID=327061 RepID=UPI002008CFB4|nr:S-adenosyl-L-methionine-dependent methyltransferase [Annulohypoxylon truncatum]KAI1210083.1 S-adenosyl-L-methionine-dependent methyltransferase [Annulohypoxylon truncatum]
MAAPSGFVPKQAMLFDDKLFQIIGADETLTIAQYEMSILPTFPLDSIIHDNACGLGPVTQSILATSPSDTIKFHATDVAPPIKLVFSNSTFAHSFLSFGLPIIDDPVAAAKEMYRTLKTGGTAITAFWLSILQGESAQETRRAVWGPDTRLAVEPKMRHNDREYIRNQLVEGGFGFEDVQLAIGQPAGGWKKEDEEKWDTEVAKYKDILTKKEGFHVDGDSKITLEAVAHVAIVKKPN